MIRGGINAYRKGQFQSKGGHFRGGVICGRYMDQIMEKSVGGCTYWIVKKKGWYHYPTNLASLLPIYEGGGGWGGEEMGGVQFCDIVCCLGHNGGGGGVGTG